MQIIIDNPKFKIGDQVTVNNYKAIRHELCGTVSEIYCEVWLKDDGTPDLLAIVWYFEVTFPVAKTECLEADYFIEDDLTDSKEEKE